jgi:aldose 1-epimerase
MATPIRLGAGPLTLELDPRGAAITRFSCRGADGAERPLLRPASSYAGDPLTAGCFPLLPFGNRVRGNRFSFGGADYALAPNQPWDRHYLHGDGWLSLWEVADVSPRAATLSLRCWGDELSPYAYDATIAFALTEDVLSIRLAVTNRHATALPFGLGLHPYFPLTPHTTLQAAARRFFTEEADYLPGAATEIPPDLDFSTAQRLPRHWINNGFAGWDGGAAILWPEHGLGLRIQAEAAFGHYFVFMSDRRFEPGFAEDYFCFEPMTHQADAHHAADLGGLAVLAPGECLAATVAFHLASIHKPA